LSSKEDVHESHVLQGAIGAAADDEDARDKLTVHWKASFDAMNVAQSTGHASTE